MGLGACTSSVNPDAIVGSWRYSDGKRIVSEITFRSDRSFNGRITLEGKTYGEAQGKWSVTGNTLNYFYTSSSLPRVPSNAVDKDTIKQITSTYFIILSRSGEVRQYERVDRTN